jgi:hypothetical protein
MQVSETPSLPLPNFFVAGISWLYAHRILSSWITYMTRRNHAADLPATN